jgi:hypothetical protein
MISRSPGTVLAGLAMEIDVPAAGMVAEVTSATWTPLLQLVVVSEAVAATDRQVLAVARNRYWYVVAAARVVLSVVADVARPATAVAALVAAPTVRSQV